MATRFTTSSYRFASEVKLSPVKKFHPETGGWFLEAYSVMTNCDEFNCQRDEFNSQVDKFNSQNDEFISQWDKLNCKSNQFNCQNLY